ncbi:MAG: hypothetical protein ACREJC_03145, partial [Tepidisphaeraceae bacterium]
MSGGSSPTDAVFDTAQRRVGSGIASTVHIVAVTHSSELGGSDVHSDTAPGFPIKPSDARSV